MGESRMFEVGNELTDLPRRIWYYDTINVAVNVLSQLLADRWIPFEPRPKRCGSRCVEGMSFQPGSSEFKRPFAFGRAC